MLDAIYNFDIRLYLWLRGALFSPFMESFAKILGNPYGWMPVFAMVAALLYVHRPQKLGRDLFFGLVAFVLSYQVSQVLGYFVQRKSPASLESIIRAADGEEILLQLDDFSFPDWAVAAMAGVLIFVRLRMEEKRRFLVLLAGFSLGLLILCRVYSGQCFPLDAVGGLLVGMLMGILSARVAAGMDRFSVKVS
ncbi:MAG: hypothetical protein H6581_15525 [Bacteroidia bacterium]|nr:hypothetical protein [Bacteroidia bacterium]